MPSTNKWNIDIEIHALEPNKIRQVVGSFHLFAYTKTALYWEIANEQTSKQANKQTSKRANGQENEKINNIIWVQQVHKFTSFMSFTSLCYAPNAFYYFRQRLHLCNSQTKTYSTYLWIITCIYRHFENRFRLKILNVIVWITTINLDFCFFFLELGEWKTNFAQDFTQISHNFKMNRFIW